MEGRLLSGNTPLKSAVATWDEDLCKKRLAGLDQSTLLTITQLILLLIRDEIQKSETLPVLDVCTKIVKIVDDQASSRIRPPKAACAISPQLLKSAQLDVLGKSNRFRPPQPAHETVKQPSTGPKAVSSKWIQLHWSAANGSPSRVAAANPVEWSKKMSPMIDTAKNVFEIHDEDIVVKFASLGDSVYDRVGITEYDIETAILNNPNISEGFAKRQKVPKTSAPPISNPKPELLVAERTCVLGNSAAQRIGITLNVLKKSHGSWDNFKRSFAECTLNRQDLTLLMDTIPDENNAASQKKYAEWMCLVEKVRELSLIPGVSLREDEDYVLFMSSQSSLHQRLESMYIMLTFDDIMSGFSKQMDTLCDGVQLLANSVELKLMFHAFLCLGNFLNANTTKGNRLWFRLDDIVTAASVRGVKGHTYLGIVAETVGPILDKFPVHELQKAKDSSVSNVFEMVINILDAFMLFLASNNSKSADPDVYWIRLGEFARSKKNEMKVMVQKAVMFYILYSKLCYYFGDPEACLPYDKRIRDEVSGQSRTTPDIFARMLDFISAVKGTGKHRIAPPSAKIQLSAGTTKEVAAKDTSTSCETPSATVPRAKDTLKPKERITKLNVPEEDSQNADYEVRTPRIPPTNRALKVEPILSTPCKVEQTTYVSCPDVNSIWNHYSASIETPLSEALPPPVYIAPSQLQPTEGLTTRRRRRASIRAVYELAKRVQQAID